MATHYWNPTATDVNAAASYLDAPGGSTSSVPTTGDTLIFYEGSPNISANLGALASVNLEAVEFKPNFYGTTPVGEALQLQVSNSADSYLNYDASGARFAIQVATQIDAIHASPSSGQLIITGSGTLTDLYTYRGSVAIEGSAVPATWRNYGAAVTMNDGSAVTAFENFAGVVEAERAFTTATAYGGECTITGANAVGTLNVNGGRWIHSSSGTVTTANFRTGYLSPEGAPVNPTITTLNLYGSPDTGMYVSKVGLTEFSVGTTNTFGTQAGVIKPSGGTGAS